MGLPFVLIDFENVQPKILDRMKPGAIRVKVFLGQHQSKLALELVRRLQPFGNDAEYIPIQGSGPDAVDFHIAFYIGQLAAKEPTTSFTIVSKDKGFDPLIRHLKALGLHCERLPELPELATAGPAQPVAHAAPARSRAPKPVEKPTPKVANKPAAGKPDTASSPRARAKAVVEHLKRSSKPAKLSTLRSSIKAWFKPALDDKAVDAVLQSLQDTKKVAIAGAKVSYTLG